MTDLMIEGFAVKEKIYESTRSLLFRADENNTGRSVILKVHPNPRPTPEEAARFHNEYNIVTRLKDTGAVRALEIKKGDNYQAIVFEDSGGVALKRILEQGKIPLANFLELSLKMAMVVGEIHDHNVIHKDINPANFIWNQNENQVNLIDFGISVESGGELTEAAGVNGLEGTLAYISPEQTGRTNRPLDYRSDYYSLGITFYLMLTGKLPFNYNDAMEIIHSHIALTPDAPHVVSPDVPPALSAIILKLLSKNPEDRYQTNAGLIADLKRCRDELKSTGVISDFIPGENDMSDRFEIPQKLYGREEKLETLLKAFERTASGAAEILFVKGIPGIGKTALIKEIHRPVTRLNGYFVKGKYDQFQRDVPYSALIQAFQQLVRRLLTEPEAIIEKRKEVLEKVLGENSQVIAEVIPDIELIIGASPPPPILGPVESQNRFKSIFRGFIKAFADVEHPLAIFLDDLQWADLASLELIKNMLSEPDARHLFFICSYRDNEVDNTHPLMSMQEELEKSGCNLSDIHLGALQPSHICDLVADVLHTTVEKAAELAELLFAKTGGTPFFINKFLENLNREGMITYNSGTGWNWDMAGIRSLQVTDNVVELMANRIKELSDGAREILKTASAINNRFDFKTLELILEKDSIEFDSDLSRLLKEGLIIKVKETFHFAHDRIQEAAYSLISEKERDPLHLKLGRLFLKNSTPENLEDKIFTITHHLNAGVDLIKDKSEKQKLAELNFIAGKKAKASAAYFPAFTFLKTCLDFPESRNWKTNYKQTLEYYTEATEAAYLNARFDYMDRWGEEIIQNAENVLDTLRIHEIKIASLLGVNKPTEALEYALPVLKKLGLSFKLHPGKASVLSAVVKTKILLRNKSIQDLENLPELTDQLKIATIKLLNSAGSAAYFASPNLFAILILNMVSYSVKYGNSRFSCFAYSTYGIILCGELFDLQAGYDIGQLALKLLDRFHARDQESRTKLIVYHFLTHCLRPLSETIKPLRDVYEIGLQTGDFEYSSYGAITTLTHSFFSGMKLDEVYEKMKNYQGAIKQLEQTQSLYLLGIITQNVANLVEFIDEPEKYKGEYYNEEKLLDYFIQDRQATSLGYHYANKVFIACLFNKYDLAVEVGKQGVSALPGIIAQMNVSHFYLYYALALLARNHPVSSKTRQKDIKLARKIIKKFKLWAKHAPTNFASKLALLEGEMAVLNNKPEQATKLFDRAALLAEENGLLHDQALAQERAGRFWDERGSENFALLYINQAWRSYRYWGALNKAAHLEKEFPRLLNRALREEQSDSKNPGSDTHTESLTTQSMTTHTTSVNSRLDISSAVKMSQTLSGEIVLEKLLKKAIRLVIQNAGAQRGFYIKNNNGRLTLEVEGTPGLPGESVNGGPGENAILHNSRPLDETDKLSKQVIHYVARTQKPLVLNNACESGDFSSDPYITKNQVRSVLCLPLLNRSELAGLLYLENNISRNTFTEDRLEVLNLLTTQIAISLDNATLYTNLEEQIKERTARLSKTLEEVQTLKNRQDGDYYLTSQMIKPLAQNHVKSERIKVDFFIKQMKQFEFKRWQEEIGGDLCVAHSIKLKDEPHTVFINADAMGKSIQGAGGVLVLGAVFRSLVERSHKSPEMQNQTAKKWLLDMLDELRKVFDSFDGLMMISLIAGLVNENTGEFYFVNAEHPFTVLYRGGQSRFLEKELVFHKLGNLLNKGKIPVYQMKLQPGDIIICGSDGRDDILVARDQSGRRQVNEDEKEFLNRVNEGAGDLEKIYQALLAQGEQTDDLSMLRLEYI